MHPPMRVEDAPGASPRPAPARELLVEGDTANYRFLFSQVEAPSPESLAGFFQPRLSAGEIQFARQFNENQSAMARDGLDRQVEMAKQMIEKYNDAIRALNSRVARPERGGRRGHPAGARGRAVLARDGTGDRVHSRSRPPQPTITEIVAPLYSPTFVPTPVPC